MAEDDQPGSDPDRAAILARRQRFIALALTGLATGAGCKGEPQPCLSIAAPEGHGSPPEAETGATETGATETGATEAGAADPNQPFVEEPGVPVEAATTGETEPPDESHKAAPEPCLKVKPRPCLKKAKP